MRFVATRPVDCCCATGAKARATAVWITSGSTGWCFNAQEGFVLIFCSILFRLAHKEICVAPALPPPKALLSTEAVKAGADMRRCLETIRENLANGKKLVVLLGLLVRLLSRDDGHAAGVARTEFYQHGGMEVLEALLRQRPTDAAVNNCIAILLPKLDGYFVNIGVCVFFSICCFIFIMSRFLFSFYLALRRSSGRTRRCHTGFASRAYDSSSIAYSARWYFFVSFSIILYQTSCDIDQSFILFQKKLNVLKKKYVNKNCTVLLHFFYF